MSILHAHEVRFHQMMPDQQDSANSLRCDRPGASREASSVIRGEIWGQGTHKILVADSLVRLEKS
jgi:hypothetical protein